MLNTGSKENMRIIWPPESPLETVENNLVKLPHGIALQVPKVTAITSKKGTREEYI